ncbi:hypothetical protein Tco_0699694 [Tanacetum coccineum]
MRMESPSLFVVVKLVNKHAKLDDIQELLHQLLNDLQIISEELSEFVNCPSWNRPTFYDNDDEEYFIQFKEYLKNSSKAITPDLPTEEPEYSLMKDESLSDEDVPEDNVKIYLNPLFEFNDGYISSDVNPLFDEVLEDIKFKDSLDSNLDESTFLVTPLSDSNKDEWFTPCDDVELLLHHDPSISIVSILEGFTNEPHSLRNLDYLIWNLKENIEEELYDAPFNNFDELNEDKCFDPRGGEIVFSQNVEDNDSFTFFIWTFILLLTYPVDSLYFSPTRMKTPFLTPAFPLKNPGGITSGWNSSCALMI